MRVLLVYPFDPADRRFGPPKMGLGLAYIAAVLRDAGCEVRILDKWAEYRLTGLDRERTERLLDESLASFAPDVVGFSTYTALIADVIKDARRVKHLCPHSVVVIGGPHATTLPEETLRRYPFIDIAVQGEGEAAMLELSRGTALEQIAGITFARGGEIVRTNKARAVVSLDDLPMPARDLMRMDYYTERSRDFPSRGGGLRYATILSSRGCFAKCSFCLFAEVPRKLGWHSGRRVVAEMQHVLAAYPQVTGFEFIDPLFLSNPRATEELCHEMIAAGLHRRVRWKAQTRVDRASPAVFELMREAGCFMVGFGFESGAQRVLDVMQKRATVEDISATTEAARGAGLEVDAYFLYGYPEEDEDDMLLTLEVLDRLQPDFAGYGRYFLVPGTPDYARVLARGDMPKRYDDPTLDWEKVDLLSARSPPNFSRMSDARLRHLERLAYRAVVSPINVRYHLRTFGVGALRDPRFAFTAAKTWIMSRPPWLRMERGAMSVGASRPARAGRLARAALGALGNELAPSLRDKTAASALRASLERAATCVAFYRGRAASAGVRPTDALGHWPLTRPEDVRGVPPERLVARGTRLSACRVERTSGSTGSALSVFLDEHDQDVLDVLWHRSYFHMGLRPTDRQVHLRDPDPAAEALLRRGLRSMLGLPQTLFIPISQDIDAMLAELRRARADVLVALPHALARVARRLRERNEVLPGLRHVFAPGAPLLPDAVGLIRERLGVVPQSAYGTAELGFVAWGCSAGRSHVSSDHVHVEWLGDGADGRANLAVTTLQRHAMPFVRYVPGDVVTPPTGRCPCGSSWPELGRFVGRESSFLRPPTTRRPISEPALATVLARVGGSDRLQVIQHGAREVELLVEDTIDRAPEMLGRARAAVAGLMGPDVDVQGRLVSPFRPAGIGKRDFIRGLEGLRG